MLHITELNDFSPLHVAFTAYVIHDYTDEKLKDLYFEQTLEPFGRGEAKYVRRIQTSPNHIAEFWIVYIEDKPAAIAQRVLVKGHVIDRSLGFIQFEMKPYHLEGVLKMINDLPKQTKNAIH